MLHNARLAKNLNALCGCTTFTAWNVGEVPDIDLWEIGKYYEWAAKVKEHYG